MQLKRNHHSGQSMLEAIVAIGVILSAVIGSSTLIVSSITASRVSQNRIEAANFAREGVEVIRALRDSNWLKFQQNEPDPSTAVPPVWNANIGSPIVSTPISYRIIFSYGTTNRWQIQNCGSCLTDSIVVYRVTYTNVPNNIVRNWYSQYLNATTCNSSGRSCTPTKYSRILTLTLKPEDVNDNGVTTDVEDVYLLVESKVTWNDRTGPKSLTAQTRLYDWK